MLKNRATAQASAAYASRMPICREISARARARISSIGVGTYLGETDEETDADYEESIRAALPGESTSSIRR